MADFRIPGESTVVTESLTAKVETDPEKAKRERDEQVLKLARKRFKQSVAGWGHFRTQALDDTRFRAGTWGMKSFQWHTGIQEKREAADRPCLTVNRAPGFVRQVTNQARQAHLVISVSPVDDHGDVKIAEVLQGIIHNIEATSFADRAYATGSEKQAEIGLGVFRLITEWADQKTFRQRIKIKRERNPLSVYFDPSAQEADLSDGWAFKVTDLDIEDWKQITGKTEPPTAAALEGFEADGDQTGDWFPNGKIRYVEYFCRENKGPRKHIAQLSTGDTIEYPDAGQLAALNAMGITVKNHRYTQEKITVWRKMDALTIHEETEWKADSHPFFPVIGDDLQVDGERDLRGVIRDSKESGRIYNVEVSALVESVGLGQKAPVVGYRGQFGADGTKMRKAWETANTQPHAFLEVEPVDIDGKPAPIPARVPMETNIQGIVIAIHQADEDYKTTAGFRDASLGERGPQESGKAILARQHQDEFGSSHYLDNLRFALASAGRQLIQLIRVVYDVATVLRIKGNDDRQRKVMVFSGAHNDPRQSKYLQKDSLGADIPFQLPEGVDEIYDLSVGEFDVEVSARSSSGTRRQEAVDAMTSLFKEMPPEMSVKFLDLYFKVQDFPGAQQLYERAKKLLSPELRDDADGAAKIPPQVQQQMAQMKQHLEELMQQHEKALEEIKTERAKTEAAKEIKAAELQSKERMHQDDLDSKERLELMKQRAALLEQRIALKGEAAILLLEAELDRMAQQQTLHHERRLAELDAGERSADRDADTRRHAIDTRAEDRRHAIDTAEAAAQHTIDTATAQAQMEADAAAAETSGERA